MDSPDPSASSKHTRSLRSFALREDAERVRAALADHNIECTIREFLVPDTLTGKPVSRGCSLYVDPAQAKEATRLVMKLPPSETAAAVSAKPAGPSRLRRRVGPPVKQKGSQLMVFFAIACAAGGIIFGATYLGRPKQANKPAVSTDDIVVEEDLNDDSIPDVRRVFNYKWEPLYHEEDRNFDNSMDVKWTWQRGKPAYRDVDLDFDGKFDEHTTYDPEGKPFYTDTRRGGSGPPLIRRVYRDGSLWKLLEDRDADAHFDHLTEFDYTGATIREEDLAKDSPEEKVPAWPPPPAPPRPGEDEEEDTTRMKVKP